jgi:peptidylprolyl isomerase
MTTLSNHLRASVLFVLNLLTMLPLKKNRVLEYPYQTLIGKLMKFIILVVAIALTIFYFARNSINKKEAVENIAIGKDFLAKNKTIEGVIETASGLQYQVLQKGEGSEHPSASTKVKVHYHGTLLDGTVFDSSVERDEPINFPLNQVIKGWTEGVQLMVVGDKFKFFIPSELGYGNRATGKITSGSLLIFEVALLDIQ